jgi:hypothetical protein
MAIYGGPKPGYILARHGVSVHLFFIFSHKAGNKSAEKSISGFLQKVPEVLYTSIYFLQIPYIFL